MFCKNCGYDVAEGAAFCQKCGTRLADELKQEPVKEETPVQETVAQETVAQETVAQETVAQETVAQETVAQEAATQVAENVETESAFATLDTPEEKPKKRKKRGWLVAGIVAGSLAVLTILAIFFGPKWFPNLYRNVAGWTIKTFGSPDNYLQFVEENATAKTVDGVVSAYSKYLDRLGNNKLTSGAVQTTVQLQVGDKVTSMAEDSLAMAGEPMDLDWLKSVSLAMDANMKDSAGQILLALSLNNKQVANADVIMDMEQGALYFALRPLSDKYLKSDLAINENVSEILGTMSSSEIKEVLPAPETVGVLVERYSKLFYEGLKDAEKTTETIEINGVEQKVTVLRVELDSDAVQQMLEIMLETLAEDEEVRQILVNIEDYLQQKGEIPAEDTIYDAFTMAIEEAIDGLDEMEFDDFDNLGISFYVNNTHDIIGMQYEIDSDSVRYITIRDGDAFAFELDADVLKITGSGTEKDEMVNGEYTFEYEGKKLFVVKAENFSQKDNLLKGKLVLTPTKNLLETMGLDSSVNALVALADPALELVFDNTANSTKMEVNLLSGKDLLVGIAITAQEKTASDIAMPDSNQVVSENNVEQWVNSLDLDRLYDVLVQAGLPDVIAEALVLQLQGQGAF